MKRFGLTAIAASAMLAAVSMLALGQTATTLCAKGDGQVLEYDFRLDEAGSPTLDKWAATPRLVSSNCLSGSAGKITFRGVNAEFKTDRDIGKALEAAEMFVAIGLNDPAAIKQLLERVAPVKARMDAQPKKVASDKRTEPFSSIFKDEPKK